MTLGHLIVATIYTAELAFTYYGALGLYKLTYLTWHRP